ncbi:hypothetical protein SY88_07870 [Clostridiales bacterium PH28_bin88]|nr:hypothetical protein SY88_07870 [Clostridiales bacterium PH28_bin88]
MSLLWLVIGASAVLAIQGLIQWSRERGIILTWWKWVLIILWVLLCGSSLAFITTNLGEREAKAVLTGSMSLIPLTVIAGGILWRFVINRKSGEMAK